MDLLKKTLDRRYELSYHYDLDFRSYPEEDIRADDSKVTLTVREYKEKIIGTESIIIKGQITAEITITKQYNDIKKLGDEVAELMLKYITEIDLKNDNTY